jgi:hypothetical protein
VSAPSARSKGPARLGGWKTSMTLVEVYVQPYEEAQRRALALDDSV